MLHGGGLEDGRWGEGEGGRWGEGEVGGGGGGEHVTLSCNVCQYFLQHCKQLQESLGLEGMFFFKYIFGS